MVYDCFPVLNEIRIIELRLEMLSPLVDRFVIVESTKTFWGDEKPLYFEQYLAEGRLDRWKDKIIHHIVDDMPETDPIEREGHQRNAFKKVLPKVDSRDKVLFMDVDEFPKPKVISTFSPDSKCWSLQMYHHLGFLNVRRRDFDYCPKILSGAVWNDLQDLDSFRWVDNAWREDKWTKDGTPRGFPIMPEAGWHFTYMGGMEQIRKKVMSGSHRWNNNTWQAMLDDYTEKGVYGAEKTRCLVLPFTEDFFPNCLVAQADQLMKEGYLLPW